MNKRLWLIGVGIASLLAGCAAQKARVSVVSSPAMVAQHTATPVKIDGKLDDPVWKQAPAYPINLADDLVSQGFCIQESGEVRLAWDDQFIYIGVRFIDSDLAAQGTGDEQPHYQLGDVAEVFLKPQNNTWYWELYVTPAGKKTRYWFPGCGWLGLSAQLNTLNTIVVAAQNQGTLNQWKDRDESWTAEMAVPITELTTFGDTFGLDSDWRILIGRYNYSRYLSRPGPEISMAPPIRTTSFHRIGDYARLILKK